MSKFNILRTSPNYPPRLKHLACPPLRLYAEGNLSALGGPAIAVIGTRQASPYGLMVARDLGRYLAQQGVIVISGLARGVDAAAHRGCLEIKTGRPVGVVACGLDRIYPPEHGNLQRDVARRGLLLSEYGPGQPPCAFHFPQRNRIVAALCHARVVVEAPLKSGALITVGQALDLGREVFVVPGPLNRGVCSGNLRLLREGATPLCEFSDLLQALPGAQDEELANSVSLHGCTVEEMCQAWRTTPKELLPRLLHMELCGLLRRQGDRYYAAKITS